MSSEAFDLLLSRLDPDDRERIREMAIAYGLTFDDPSWIPFAITQMTLDELKAQIKDATTAIEDAADLALRKIGNRAREASHQAQAVIDAQSKAVLGLRETMLDIERASAVEYRKVLAELAVRQITKLVDKGTNGIVRDVTQCLIGRDGLLIHSATEHGAALEQVRQRFVASVDAAVAKVDDAARRTAASTRRGVRHAVALAMGTVVVYAALMFGLMVYWSNHQPASDAPASATCRAQQRPAHPLK
ncbi:hypothetical protein WS87_13275 [Burkholderia sp. MSMB0856]|uniref:hypothetical protein n=1 Tax=Burkholderia sp. MSMB0856 TaxID=1637869 RepID=UPI00075E332B|nr:hypothetical protein [Burkholderia sp. MSMB0856]AOJ87572.1 hypothetical protein WS87_13275 [Burkholderia sp. MSMB0856]KVH29276.1 hypothetical protein WS87_27910 [Burkholderia sp. MSMB0856]